MVVTCLRPTVETEVMQLLVGTPLRCTVQAPHLPTPQPYLVPTSSRWSRSTHSNGVSEATSTLRDWPLMLRVYFAMTRFWDGGAPAEYRTNAKTVENKKPAVNQ